MNKLPSSSTGSVVMQLKMVEADAKNSNRREVPVEVAILETKARLLYQQMARKALPLRELGLSHCAIGRRLKVEDKTVAQAVRWQQSST